MIQRIKTHNVLNGLRFSIAEFVFISLVILPFAIYYLAYARWIYGLATVGIICNCLTVAMFGIRQLSDGENDGGLKRMLDRRKREDIRRANPHLLRDTLVITLTALLPYVLLLLVMVEFLTGVGEHRP